MRIENIQKSYGKKIVLKNINLTTEKGKCIGLLGGNGSGKSTLLSIVAGVHKGDGNGKVIFEDKDLLRDGNLRSEIIGYVPQSTPLLEELSALDNLRLWYPENEIKESLKSGVLGMLGIGEFLKVPVCKMSGGMKKRLAIGCSVAHNPKILLLDEPSAALDLVCKERIANYLVEFKNRGGIVILATHDIGELELCDELYILKDGILNEFKFDGNVHRLVGSL